jgi:hypothetical protein
VYVFGDCEYVEDEVPSDLDTADADWSGCRAWRDLEDGDPDGGETIGFACEFHDDHDTLDGWGRHLWLHTEESGCPERAAQLVQKFLKEFRPRECWSLTYATTCSKPRVGEFAGGAVFVTADEIKWQDASDSTEQEHKAFLENRCHRQETERLTQEAELQCLQPEQLDDLVHEAASAYAARINNGGLQEQIEYLVAELGAAETEKALASLIADQRNRPRKTP